MTDNKPVATSHTDYAVRWLDGEIQRTYSGSFEDVQNSCLEKQRQSYRDLGTYVPFEILERAVRVTTGPWIPISN